jgi:methyl-accepting chemotaxis protein
MQRSLQGEVRELEEETVLLRQHGEMLHAEYESVLDTNTLKSSVLNYMTHQLVDPAEQIDSSATILCNKDDRSEEEKHQEADNIQRKSQTMVDLLNHIAHFTDKEIGKEASYES